MSPTGRFIVRLCHEDHRERVARHVQERHLDRDAPDFEAKVERHVAHLARIPSIVLTDASRAAVDELQGLGGAVCGVELSRVVRAAQSDIDDIVRPEGDVFWHLDRLDGAIDGIVDATTTGAGVKIFVLDSGLDTTSAEFGGSRTVANVASFADLRQWRYMPEWGWDDVPPDDLTNNDYDGHGSHVAGDCCGVSTGPAPGADLFAIKVLDNQGSGFDDWILTALDDIASLKGSVLADEVVIVNLSLGGPCQSDDPLVCSEQGVYPDAISSLHDLGVAVTVAAGNDAQDACYYTPAAARDAITIGATDSQDEVASFSNYGACVDVMAPGDTIASVATSRLGSAASGSLTDDGYYVLSGTSMAAPVVAGVLAQFVEALGPPADGDVTDAQNALFNSAAAGLLSFSFNPGAQATTCPSNDLLVQAPSNVDDSIVSDYVLECELPSVRVIEPIIIDVDTYNTTDVGYCYSSLDHYFLGPSSPENCWNVCVNRFGEENVVSIDWYAPWNCFCQNFCK